MRRKLSLTAAGLVAGATLSLGAAAPAHAQTCESTDPVVAYVCMTVDQVGPWVDYYYHEAGEAAKYVYCTVWPELCW